MLAAFDCLFLNEDLRQRPLGQRRVVLKETIRDIKNPLIRLSPARELSSQKELEILSRWAATRPGSTGLMVKDLTQPRQSGGSNDWALLKAEAVQKDPIPRLTIEVKGSPDARVAFIAASPNEIEAARCLRG